MANRDRLGKVAIEGYVELLPITRTTADADDLPNLLP